MSGLDLFPYLEHISDTFLLCTIQKGQIDCFLKIQKVQTTYFGVSQEKTIMKHVFEYSCLLAYFIFI